MTGHRFERTPPAGGPLVRGFSGKSFRTDAGTFDAVLLTPERGGAWAARSLDALTTDDFAPVLALAPPPEFLILGTGATTRFPPRALVAALEEKGIGIEAMDSRAAARTYGLLRGEGRWIAAALLPL